MDRGSYDFYHGVNIMTIMHFILVVTHAAMFGGGYYAHHRYGATLAADALAIKAKMGKRPT